VTGTANYKADSEQSQFNGTSLSYDANGNLTGDGTNTWDARNHLTQITQRRTTVGSFAYGGFGRRAVAKVDFHCGELFPRVGFIVTNLATLSSRAVVRLYNKRGTAEP
jgi:YD repeat-containing protein